MKDVDAADLRILSVLQDDGSLSVADISERVHLSTNACWRRLRRLETEGILQKRVAIIDPAALGLSVVAYVRIRLTDHRSQNVRQFVDEVSQWDEVTEICAMASDQALLLKTYSASLAAHARLVERMENRFSAESVTSDFVLTAHYHTTALPM